MENRMHNFPPSNLGDEELLKYILLNYWDKDKDLPLAWQKEMYRRFAKALDFIDGYAKQY